MRKTVESIALVCVLAVAGGLVGCGGQESGDDGEDRQAPPLELKDPKLGVGLHHGELGNLAQEGDPGQEVLDRATATFDHAFLHLQAYDEHAPQFGDWKWMPPTDRTDYRGAGQFIDHPDRAKLLPRSKDLFDEVESASEGGFETTGVVVDFWRTRDDWYVRWDGNLDSEANRIGEGPYGFYRSDMSESLVGQIRDMAADQTPDYLVVGTDMERLLGTEDGPGLAPDEFSNFKRFYRRVVEAVKQVSPDTKIGAGINWDRFARHVAPQYGTDSEPGTAPDEATLATAFEAVVVPLVEVGDMVALKSYRTVEGEEGEGSYYGFLAELEDRFGIGKPVVWYSIGTPLPSSTSYRKQTLYLQAFQEWNAGVDPELVGWRALTNIDGADAGDQEVDGRCKQMVETEALSMPKSHCFDGLFTTLSEAKEVFGLFEDAGD